MFIHQEEKTFDRHSYFSEKVGSLNFQYTHLIVKIEILCIKNTKTKKWVSYNILVIFFLSSSMRHFTQIYVENFLD